MSNAATVAGVAVMTATTIVGSTNIIVRATMADVITTRRARTMDALNLPDLRDDAARTLGVVRVCAVAAVVLLAVGVLVVATRGHGGTS